MQPTMVRKLSDSFIRLALALVAAPAFAAGCAENHASVSIRQLMVAQANPASPLACTAAPDPGAPKILTSVLDVALRDNYVAYPLVQNNLYASRALESNRPEQRGLVAQFVDVELTTVDGANRLSLTDENGDAVPSRYRVPARSDLIPPGAAGNPGFAVIEMPVIPSNVGRALRERLGCTGFAAGAPPAPFCSNDSQTIRVTLRPTFRTQGGVELSSVVGSVWENVAPYSFPLTVCCGCLLNFPPNVDRACRPTGGMAAGGGTGTATTGYCLVGQDFPTLCTSCMGRPECSREGC
jgi:hypothetical protein